MHELHDIYSDTGGFFPRESRKQAILAGKPIEQTIMKSAAGFLAVIACVLGGYLLSHGRLSALFQPYELLIIAGAAIGAFIIANPLHLVRQVGRELPKLFVGKAYGRNDYLELLSFLFALLNKVRKEGHLALESDIDNPEDSTLFERFPGIAGNAHAMEFISDHLRLMLSGAIPEHHMEELMDAAIESDHHDAKAAGDAVNQVADALPGFGIVAAVLGVVITMGSLDQPPEVLGDHIAAALVGTFLGILLAYGFVGPVATAMKHQADEATQYLATIKACLAAMVLGYPPMVSVELGRKTLPPHLRPGLVELEAHLRDATGRSASTGDEQTAEAA